MFFIVPIFAWNDIFIIKIKFNKYHNVIWLPFCSSFADCVYNGGLDIICEYSIYMWQRQRIHQWRWRSDPDFVPVPWEFIIRINKSIFFILRECGLYSDSPSGATNNISSKVGNLCQWKWQKTSKTFLGKLPCDASITARKFSELCRQWELRSLLILVSFLVAKPKVKYLKETYNKGIKF